MSFNLKEMDRLWKGLQGVKGNPKMMEILTLYLDMAIAKQEGRLTPEAVERLENLNKFIHCIHLFYCESPRPTPTQARTLINEVRELVKGTPGGEETVTALERDFPSQ